jgi:AcrR family transcriptional regulator
MSEATVSEGSAQAERLRARIDAIVADAEGEVAQMLDRVPRVTDNQDLLDRRRADIVASAYAEFAARGFHGTSVSDVARRAGIDKRTLYDYVADKEDVLYLLFLHHLAEELHLLGAAITADDGPEQQLHNLIEAHLDFIMDREELALLTYREMRNLDRARISNCLYLIECIMRVYDAVIEWGVAQGVLECESPRIAGHAVRAALDMPGLAMWDLRRYSRAEITRSVHALILQGLVAKRAD